jgi:hypothetical protein
MSLFNEHQEEFMRSLARIPAENKCWCGWYLAGECHTCPKDVTNADKLKVWCPECKNTPSNYGKGELIHSIFCSHNPYSNGLPPQAKP